MLGIFKKKKKKVGLCLGGGGTRGFAHLGAIKAFEEYGIKFDEVAGTSVGSVVGALYCSNLNFHQMYKISLIFTNNIYQLRIKYIVVFYIFQLRYV